MTYNIKMPYARIPIALSETGANRRSASGGRYSEAVR